MHLIYAFAHHSDVMAYIPSLLLQKYVVPKSFMIYFYYYDVTAKKKLASLSVSSPYVFLDSIFYIHALYVRKC